MKKHQEELVQLLERVYAPYSRFYVASILMSKGKIVGKGVNVENAAYPSGICAERNALWSSITNGLDTKKVDEIHVMTKLTDKFISPCGACRQVMTEHLISDTKVFLHTYSGLIKKFILKDLMPLMVTNDELFGGN